MGTVAAPEGEPTAAEAAAPATTGAKVEEARKENKGRGGGGGGKERKRKKEVFIYGNYKSYYGYRIDRNVGEDPRLEVFKREWFAGKDCLDIGCNQGLVTIGLAMKFQCQSIVGVDIDAGLIETAHWNLRKKARSKVTIGNMKVPNSSNSFSQCSPKDLVSETSNGHASNSKHSDLSKIVSFRCENFVERQRCSENYDTIICLSVTKWIHLNWGDDGLITLFVKIWRLLKPGGIFILEAQPWTSYKRNRLVSETARVNFTSICIYPEKFREILLDKVGFRSTQVITDRLLGAATGFDRPIEVYYK